MKREPEAADDLVRELRSMALLDPGVNQASLRRAREIRVQLTGMTPSARSISTAAATALGQLEILLSHRRWKTEANSVEALRKDIKSACDRLRVAVEAALHAGRTTGNR